MKILINRDTLITKLMPSSISSQKSGERHMKTEIILRNSPIPASIWMEQKYAAKFNQLPEYQNKK